MQLRKRKKSDLSKIYKITKPLKFKPKQKRMHKYSLISRQINSKTLWLGRRKTRLGFRLRMKCMKFSYPEMLSQELRQVSQIKVLAHFCSTSRVTPPRPSPEIQTRQKCSKTQISSRYYALKSSNRQMERVSFKFPKKQINFQMSQNSHLRWQN